jgi:hypothetical protein
MAETQGVKVLLLWVELGVWLVGVYGAYAGRRPTDVLLLR